MRDSNFFNFKTKNQWDIGWPCSPRKFILAIVCITTLILIITI